jgi:uncharacterized tellurite resistance protein B-like protein
MSANELKSEIHKALDRIPEEVLADVLSYLKKIEGQTADKVLMARDLKRILDEDNRLLERLAQ